MKGNTQKLKKELGAKARHIILTENHIMPQRKELEELYVSANNTLDALLTELGDSADDLADYEEWLKEE